MNNDHKNLLKGYNMLLYFAGSMLMNEPTEECISDFWTNGSLKKLPVSSSNPRFIKAAALLRDSCTDKNICSKMLAEDYFRLFAVAGLSLAPAYESIYLKKSRATEISSEKVTDFYDSYGWESRSRGKIADDHLGIELLFLTRLVEKYLSLDDDPCCCEIRNEIRRFIDQHILSWIPEWNNDIQKHANTLSYKGIGTLIYACLEDIYGLLDYRSNLL
jgi:TorA maturation chaperone TorD